MKTFHILIAVSILGCSRSDTDDPLDVKRTVVVDQVVVTTTDGQTFRGPAATIEIVAAVPNGPDVQASVAISTVDRDGLGLSLSLDLEPSALLDRAVTASLFDTSKGSLALSSASSAELIRSGRVSLTMQGGALEGSFETDHPLISSGTIQGAFNVECLVPPQVLGQTFPGRTTNGTWLLVDDEKRTSSFCASFAGLIGTL
jgi:hypothetical protein